MELIIVKHSTMRGGAYTTEFFSCEKLKKRALAFYYTKMEELEANLNKVERDLNDLLDCHYDVEFLIKKIEHDYNDWLDQVGSVDLRRAIYEEQMYILQARINAEIRLTNQRYLSFIAIHNAHIQSLRYMFGLRN